MIFLSRIFCCMEPAYPRKGRFRNSPFTTAYSPESFVHPPVLSIRIPFSFRGHSLRIHPIHRHPRPLPRVEPARHDNPLPVESLNSGTILILMNHNLYKNGNCHSAVSGPGEFTRLVVEFCAGEVKCFSEMSQAGRNLWEAASIRISMSPVICRSRSR